MADDQLGSTHEPMSTIQVYRTTRQLPLISASCVIGQLHPWLRYMYSNLLLVVQQYCVFMSIGNYIDCQTFCPLTNVIFNQLTAETTLPLGLKQSLGSQQRLAFEHFFCNHSIQCIVLVLFYQYHWKMTSNKFKNTNFQGFQDTVYLETLAETSYLFGLWPLIWHI